MPLNIRDLKISSPDIPALGAIPPQFAADTGNEAPTLEVSGVPADAKELAVILHDPDAPLANGFTHWTLYGLPTSTSKIDPAALQGRVGPHGGGQAAYTGPQPPIGHGIHHYYFWVYALDCKVEGSPSREQFLERYAGHIVEQNRFVATFRRD